jgi:hypothetical protein
MNRTFRTVALQIIAAGVLALLGQAHAQSALGQKLIIYPDGHFPSGNFYTAADLPRLSGHKFSASSPSYLIGVFGYLGVINGQETFFPVPKTSPLQPFPPPYQMPSSTTVLHVRFFNNSPKKLKAGKAIAPNPRSPLTLTSVTRSRDGHLLVQTEYWGTP